MSKYKDLTGCRFGRLTVVKDVGRNKHGKILWECRCDCGVIATVQSTCLGNGHTKSCGCLKRDITGGKNRSHALSSTREYRIWQGIKRRVTNPKSKHFERYGELGMEEDWKKDFMSFYNYIGPCPESINGEVWGVDRINTHYGYYKENVRWIPQQLQTRNSRKYCVNTSGFCGVCIRTIKSNTSVYATAYWEGLCGKRSTKSFSVLKYGLLPAFAMACAYRERMIEQLNEKGAGYAANHGK